jgi:hypothetical protein
MVGEASPLGMREWLQQFKNAMSLDDEHAIILADIVSRFVDLRASFKSRLLADADTIISQVTTLDAELDMWELLLPDRWRYEVERHPKESEFVYQGISHQYCDFWIARMHNNHRWSRILVNELLLVHIANMRSLPDIARRKEKSLPIISRLAMDICSSVSNLVVRANIIYMGQKEPMSVLSACLLILFPLCVAGSTIGVSDGLHEWAVRILGIIGDRMGVSQALSMIAWTKQQREKWRKIFGDTP